MCEAIFDWPSGEEFLTYQYRSDVKSVPVPTPVTASPSWNGPSVYRSFGKRAFDILAVVAVSVPILLTVGLLALWVRRDGGSAFFVQERVGENGETFNLLKLRTMVPDAEAVMTQYLEENPQAKLEWDHHQKLRNDPRITMAGRILRKTSLDELPQLWNVLRGDMSLVGPRPMMLEQRVLYPGTEYYEMKPGVTGYWQVSDRHETGFHERAGYDRAYYNDLSLWTDLKVIWKTVAVVLGGKGC